MSIQLAFASPRVLPKPQSLAGRVVVLDIAFAGDGGAGVSFETVTQPFLAGLGSRLAAWVDHHDHERHVEYRSDIRFVLATKSQHGGCPEMITPLLVADTGPIDSIVCHVDLDGLYSAAKWLLGGREPYPGADEDARNVDTRTGAVSATAQWIDHALRARFRDEALKHAVVQWLVTGGRSVAHRDTISEAAQEFAQREQGTRRLSDSFVIRGHVAFVDASRADFLYDKTALLLAGQGLASVAVVKDSGMLTIAAAFDSGWNFVDLFQLGGGMPTRVSVPVSRQREILDRLHAAAVPIVRS